MSVATIDKELSPGVLSLLPLFYVGWSDSVLSPTEMSLIHEAINNLKVLTKEDKKYLVKWSNPKTPPSPEVFDLWYRSIKNLSKDLPLAKKDELVKLGISIAQKKSLDNHIWKEKETVEALRNIEDALGIKSASSASILLNRLDPELADKDFEESSFSSDELRKVLDGKYIETKERMRKILSDPLFDNVYEPDKDFFRLLTLKRTKALADQGVSAYSFPKKYGGGERKGDHLAVFEMLAYSDLSLTIKFGVQFGLFGGAIYLLGTEKHHKKYLEAMHRAELLGCFAMTETGHGSNVKDLKTTIVYDSTTDELEIHSPNFAAGKEYIGNALHSTMAAVFGQLIVDDEQHGIHSVLVPLRDDDGKLLKGVKVEDCGYKLGLNGVDNGRIWFDHVRVPRENLLNKYGDINEKGEYSSTIKNPSRRFFTMLGALVLGRISVGKAGVNCSKSALTIAIKYGLKRRQFSQREGASETLLMDYPTHQKRLLPKLAKTYAYDFAIQKLMNDYLNASEDEIRKIETQAAGLKSVATWHATNTIQECREACGGKGYLRENRFADIKADADIFTTFEGDNTVLMQLVAKGLLTEFKQSFHDDGYKAVINYLFSRMKNTVDENRPFSKRNTDTSHLLSEEFHKHAFRYRYKKNLIGLSRRIQKFIKRRTDPFQAFLRTQEHLVELGHAYVEHYTLRAFYKKIEEQQDLEVKNVLTKICQLYALSTISEQRGWFLENDYIEGGKTKAIRRMVTKLCQELRPNAMGLVDAFGIPDALLKAPIALEDWS
ncbi:MAG: acyl-CoA dehydrogenase [Saprospiraceae bacterium]|nr:acyl-CoA dehydrogenase [Saprospiraceae bacterium]